MNLKIVTFILSLFFLASCNQDQFIENTPIYLTGTIKEVGNAPFSKLIIYKNNQKFAYLILKDNKNMATIKQQVGKSIKLHGQLKSFISKKPDGSPIRKQYYFYLENF